MADSDKLELEVSEVQSFVKSRVWLQIVKDVMGTALMASEDNDQIDPISGATKISRNQGKIEMAKVMVDLPGTYVEEIESQKKKEKENKL